MRTDPQRGPVSLAAIRVTGATAAKIGIAPTAVIAATLLMLVPSAASGTQEIRVAAVRIVGLDTVTPPVRLPRRLPLRPGVAYTTEAIEATEQVLRMALAESGHPHAVIEVAGEIDYTTDTAAVLFEVDPGPQARFGQVQIQAPEPLREQDVRARIAYEPGERFRTSAVERTHGALRALPGVEEVFIDIPGLGTGDTLLASVIRVVPLDRMAAVGGRATLSSLECLEVAGTWRHQHFLGGPRVLSISGGFSNLFASLLDGEFPCGSAGEEAYAQPNYFFSTELFQPIRAAPPTAIQARVFFRRRTAAQSYALHGFGVHVGAIREVRPDVQIRVAYSPERNEVRAAGHYFCVNFGACDAPAIAALSGWRWLAPVEATALWVPPAALQPFGPAWVREAGLWPGAAGPSWRPTARATVSAAAGPTGSDFRYVRGDIDGAVTRVLSPRTETAARLRVGGVGAGREMPPQVRFYSGGPNTVRGVRQNLLGPLVIVARPDEVVEAGCAPEPGGCPPDAAPRPDRVSVRPRGGRVAAEASLEGRLWLTRSFQLAAFVDAGAVLADAGPGGAGTTWESMAAPGVGFRWLTRLGPVRVDVGYDARGPRPVPMLLQDDSDGALVSLGDVQWDPHGHDDPGQWRELWRRLQVHVALGQAF